MIVALLPLWQEAERCPRPPCLSNLDDRPPLYCAKQRRTMPRLDDTGIASALSAHPVVASILAIAAASYILHAAAMFGLGTNKCPLEGKVRGRANERDGSSYASNASEWQSH